MTYEDLLLVPYKEDGRDENGMDCQGLVLECCRRAGTPLVDFTAGKRENDISTYVQNVNAHEIESPAKGCIVQCVYDGGLHIGYLIDKSTCLHMTYSGVKVSPVTSLRNKTFYEVLDDC